MTEKNDAITEANKTFAKDLAAAEHVQPMWKIVLSQFIEHKMAVIGAIIISLFLSIALLAPVIKNLSGLDPELQNPIKRYEKPMSTVALPEDQRDEQISKFIANNDELAKQIEKDLASSGSGSNSAGNSSGNSSAAEAGANPGADDGFPLLHRLANIEVAEARALLIKVGTPPALRLDKIVKNFETLHVFGTDELGRDVLIRLIYGTRVSMGIGILVALASTIIGLLIGSFAGYYGGIIDTALMRITDSLLSLPVVPVQIVIAAVDMNKLPLFKQWIGGENESMIKLVFILLLFSWMTTARLVRGSILSIREREFILAAKTLGATDLTVIFRHMFPNVVAPLLVSVTLGVGESILFEAALSFLGLGIQPPTPSWGNMLMNAQDLMYQAPFLAILPGLLILATTISFNYIGDGLQDAVDPKAIRR